MKFTQHKQSTKMGQIFGPPEALLSLCPACYYQLFLLFYYLYLFIDPYLVIATELIDIPINSHSPLLSTLLPHYCTFICPPLPFSTSFFTSVFFLYSEYTHPFFSGPGADFRAGP